MEDEHTSRLSSIASSYEENLSQLTFNPFWFTYSSILNSIRPITPIIRHNFKSIDELLSPISIPLIKIDDTGCNSQLSNSLESQENANDDDDDDNIENLKPIPSSTPFIKKNNKTKKIRTAFTNNQKQYLDRFYLTNHYPDPTQMETLSHLLLLDEKVIRVWFQNKRSREKNYSKSNHN
ncbi:unnamed protein product [Rotaria sordida]|uniref:Homeobox domain-containing protein n=1 Tax=Rotaria sordida TaxID=392033 RepID=A0A818WGH8_9BILA|nr:unnamed protein product [Rotaria sordida]CAF1041542.1 unnamed protein product [Rotaria sordida]CAF3656034.1 unnamed protein product [Rotaria sordida]CAF3725915.1 unnamed protein product [Rotaria sordida]